MIEDSSISALNAWMRTQIAISNSIMVSRKTNCGLKVDITGPKTLQIASYTDFVLLYIDEHRHIPTTSTVVLAASRVYLCWILATIQVSLPRYEACPTNCGGSCVGAVEWQWS